jgi:antiviral helicase SKI2
MNDLQMIMQGKAQKLESKFRITYSMILSLMRKKDMRIQDFMRRSFSEHKMTQAESPAVYEAANVYLNDKLEAFRRKTRADTGAVESCVYCGPSSAGTHSRRMMEYYHTCAEYTKLMQELFEKLQVNGVVFKSLTPGRVVFVKSVQHRSDEDKSIEFVSILISNKYTYLMP